jgi:prolyl-tRNA synthetase
VNLSDPATQAASERLYAGLRSAGLSVLLDDRDLRPGPRFKDADLVGVPVRVTLGERHLKDGNGEVYYRLEDRSEAVALERITQVVRDYYAPEG